MTEQDAFVKKVENELRDLARREAKLVKDEEQLRRQRTEMRSRTAELTKTLAVYKQVMGVGNTEPVPADTPTVDGTIADVAYAVLSDRGGAMRTNEIVAELLRLGKLRGESERGNYGTVYRTLTRDARFVSADPGSFSLASDQPNDPESPGQVN